MKLSKIAAVAVCGLLISGVYAQNSRSETSVEDKYLTTIEDSIVTELANADDRDNKELALKYLENAAEGGELSPDMHAALSKLAGEGITSEARTNGRLVNNFPDIRARACNILAQIHTEESKDTLKNIALKDNEPMVIAAAIRGLGEVGINDNDEVVNAIAWAQKRSAILLPTSSLAYEVLDAYEKLSGTVKENKVMVQSIAEIASNQRYVTPVREKARLLLKNLQTR